jgi:putative lipoprotein
MTENPEIQEAPQEPGSEETQSTDSNGRKIAGIVIIVIALLGLVAVVALAASGYFDQAEPTPPPAGAFITIMEPAQTAALDITSPIKVAGEGGGLFEGNVVVQALDTNGNVLVQQPTIIDAPDAGVGGAGPWSVELTIVADPGTAGQIYAFSPSPETGEAMASANVEVTYGGEPEEEEKKVKLEDHLWSLVALNGEPLIKNTLITLEFEDDQAVGSGGCNRYFTSYERSKPELSFGPIGSTEMFCEMPEGTMDQETAYFGALEAATTFTIEGVQLQIFNDAGINHLIYDAAVVGQVIGPEGAEIPAGAVVHVRLEDVSLADAEAKVIGEQVIEGAPHFPIPFTVTYDPKEIIDNHTYGMRVRIEDTSESLLYINTSAHNVITGGNPSELEVMVEAVQ